MPYFKNNLIFLFAAAIVCVTSSSCNETSPKPTDPPEVTKPFAKKKPKEDDKDSYSVEHSTAAGSDTLIISFTAKKNDTALDADSDDWSIKAWHTKDASEQVDWDSIENTALSETYSIEREEDAFKAIVYFALYEGDELRAKQEKIEIDIPVLGDDEEPGNQSEYEVEVNSVIDENNANNTKMTFVWKKNNVKLSGDTYSIKILKSTNTDPNDNQPDNWDAANELTIDKTMIIEHQDTQEIFYFYVGLFEGDQLLDSKKINITIPKKTDIFTLNITSFSKNETTPVHINFGADGNSPNDGIFPGLTWSNLPEGTNSLAIVMLDLDNAITNGTIDYSKTTIHWWAMNIPNTLSGLESNATTKNPFDNTIPNSPEGIALLISGIQDNSSTTYWAPNPGGITHPYRFILYALSATQAEFNTLVQSAMDSNNNIPSDQFTSFFLPQIINNTSDLLLLLRT